MDRKLRVAFLGCGFMGQNAHLSNYAELTDLCEVVAVADMRKGLAQNVAARYGVPHVFETYADMLAAVPFDAVVASQGFANHVNIVPMVLDSRKQLFTEKPVCISVENALRLADLADARHTLHMVGYHKRSDPASEYAKQVVDEWLATGEFGKLRLMRVSMPPGDWVGGAPPVLTDDSPYPAFTPEPSPEYFPGKLGEDYIAFVNYYIHQVNYLHYMLGEPVHVTYAASNGALLAAESASGVTATIEMAAFQSGHGWYESAFIGFEHGYIQVNLPAPLARQRAGTVRVYRGGSTGTFTEPELPNLHAMKKQAINFIAAAKGERPAPCTSRQAVEDMRVATEYIRMVNKL